AIVPTYVDSTLRGTAYGFYNLIIGLSFFIGNVVFGYVWDIFGLNVAISFSSIFVTSEIIGMIVFIRSHV
ncbi:MAG: hypothetical protein M3P28_04470, partial [Thermoproteota archaeon]|nr:hypothetical protein [Thermoproteota archaeon]